MDPLGRRCLRAAGLACLAVLALALGAGSIRLLPWLLDTNVPGRLALPFARALLAVAIETAVIVALPTGCAIAAAAFVDHGEARALHALGRSPFRLASGALPLLLVGACLAFGLLTAASANARSPGQIARELIEEGHSSCLRATEPRSLTVPLVGVTWLCFPGQTPRVVAPLPRSGGRAWLSATELRPSADLRVFELEDLRLFTRSRPNTLALKLQVDHARVSGLAPWGSPGKLGAVPRALLVVGSGLLLGWTLLLLSLGRGFRSRLGGAALGAVPAIAGLWTLHAIDASSAGPSMYVLVPLAALFGAVVGTAVGAALARALLRRSHRFEWGRR